MARQGTKPSKKSKSELLADKIPADQISANNALRLRTNVPVHDTWNLKRIFRSDNAWEKEFERWSKEVNVLADYKGRLNEPEVLAEFLRLDSGFDRRVELLMAYAYLKSTEDTANSKYLAYKSQVVSRINSLSEQVSFVRPELLSLSQAHWKRLLSAECLADWKLRLKRILRYKPHVLSAKEERIVAMTREVTQTPNNIFRLLNDADLQFESVHDENDTLKPLTQETFQCFLQSTNRRVRKEAFDNLYNGYGHLSHTFAASLEGSIKGDIFYAKARNYSSAMEASLFSEEIPRSVYDSLVAGVHEALPILYRYYELRRKKMNLEQIHFYDTYVPVESSIDFSYTYEEAVDLILKALAPLGKDYIKTLEKGLTSGRWVDKYENLNKSSGAFSYPSYDTPPYIMMNYKPDIISSVFTLIHEAGHSMHSWYSAKNQPYEYYSYEIFLAEIASTFNEQLLSQYLLKNAEDPRHRFWLINHEIDSIRATIFRQTMFSEFESLVHEAMETGTPMTMEMFRSIYRGLLDIYFGPKFTLDDALSLECFRIPHFYRAFYVYKYATGLSASLALSQRVLNGGEKERADYFELLNGGCSAAPLEILNRAGVDMTNPEVFRSAMKRFESLVNEFENFC